jgi:hypothetical protein
MTRFFAAADGSFVNVDHLVHIEIRGDTHGVYQVRGRTSIAWGTGGYGHSQGHLVILGDKFRSELDAREWVVRNFNVNTDACTVGHLQHS